MTTVSLSMSGKVRNFLFNTWLTPLSTRSSNLQFTFLITGWFFPKQEWQTTCTVNVSWFLLTVSVQSFKLKHCLCFKIVTFGVVKGHVVGDKVVRALRDSGYLVWALVNLFKIHWHSMAADPITWYIMMTELIDERIFDLVL